MNANKSVNNALSSETFGVAEKDALSDILALLKFDVDIYHNAKVCGDWHISEHDLGATCFHIAIMGSCILNVPGHLNTKLECGDLVIFPRELPHSMEPDTKLHGTQRHLAYKDANDIAGTGMLCGTVRFQHQANQYLLDALPAIFVIRNDVNNTWLASILKLIVKESLETTSATKVILNKLSELLFTYALRQYAEENKNATGLMALYSNRQLTQALNAFHANPQIPWTIESLARQAGISRTVFAEIFKTASNWTVGQYMTWWRMQMAWADLSRGDAIAQVAESVGYQSEAAFSRAFQKMFGVSAGRVRRGKKATEK